MPSPPPEVQPATFYGTSDNDIIFQNKDGVQKARVWAKPAAGAALHLSSGDATPDITIDARTMGDPARYQTASAALFRNLSGDLNGDGQSDFGVTSYMAFKPNQTGGTTAPFFVKDPFGNSYGYSTICQADSTKGYNPTFDLWSTAGTSTLGMPKPVSWVRNW